MKCCQINIGGGVIYTPPTTLEEQSKDSFKATLLPVTSKSPLPITWSGGSSSGKLTLSLTFPGSVLPLTYAYQVIEDRGKAESKEAFWFLSPSFQAHHQHHLHLLGWPKPPSNYTLECRREKERMEVVLCLHY